MILNYVFGGDDDHEGDDYDYEIEYDDVITAVADYFCSCFINDYVRKKCKTHEEVNAAKSSKTRLTVRHIIEYVLKEFDLVTDDVEEDMRDIITDYYESDAYSDYRN